MRGFSFLVLAVNLSFGFGQATVSLGQASTFAALSYASITNTGPTDIVGNIGTTGASVTGFPPGTYTGSRYLASQAITAFQAAEAAYEVVATIPNAITLTGNLGGMALAPGVYKFPSSAQLTGVLTLVGTGNCDDAWYFQIGSTLTTGIGSTVEMIGGGLSGNVFWKVGTSANIGIGTDFVGNILAAVSVTLGAEAELEGGVFALGASITLNSNFIQLGDSCSLPTTSSSPSSTSSTSSSTSSAAASSTSSSSSSTSSTSSSTSPAAASSTSSSPSSTSSASSSTSSAAASSTSSSPSSTSSASSSTSSAAASSTSSNPSSTSSASSSTSSAAASSSVSSSNPSSTAASSSSYAAASSTIISSSSPSLFATSSSVSSSPSSSSAAASSSSFNLSSSISSSLTAPISISSLQPPSSSLTVATTISTSPASVTSPLTISSPPFANSTTNSLKTSSTSSLANTFGVSSSLTSSMQAFTTSTVYTTNTYTITKCPATVTNCPVGKVTTDVISLYTTVCPIKPSPTAQPAPEFTTSTVYTTNIYTITKCPATVTNCPIGSVTTDIISLYTTVCPVTESKVNTVVTSQPNGSPARPASTLLSAAVLPTQGASVAGEAPVSIASPAAVPTALPVGASTIGAGSSTSTSAALKGAASASGVAGPAYIGPAANSGTRSWGFSTSLVLVIAVITMVL